MEKFTKDQAQVSLPGIFLGATCKDMFLVRSFSHSAVHNWTRAGLLPI